MRLPLRATEVREVAVNAGHRRAAFVRSHILVKRHGLWKPDLAAFIRAAGPEQLQMWADMPPDNPEHAEPPGEPVELSEAAARHLHTVD